MSVPLALSPGRGSVSPRLSLNYDSGAGNGPYGLGWSVDPPSISRTTDRGIPRYLDDEDTFQLSGADDLVAALSPDNRPVRRSEGAYDIRTYRPRTEGSFARLEWWRHTTSGETHWRMTSKDNITSVFGRDASARIADPADPARVFRWLLQESRDDRGDLVVYTYKQEDTAGVDVNAPHERNRAAQAQRYLKSVRYGNVENDTDFCFEAVLDYGEHDDAKPTPDEDRPWPVRLDPFSAHRAGFELRTYRLCRRVLMFHQFDELGDDPVLVGSTNLGYRHDPVLTYLTSVVQKGYVRDGAAYRGSELPPLTFGYTERRVSAEVRPLATGQGEPPARLDAAYQWTDLDGEGVSGVLTEQAGAWFYRANLGGGAIDAPKAVAPRPNGAGPGGGQGSTRHLMDLAGAGVPDLVDLGDAAPGYHARTQTAGWQDFAPFSGLPSLRWTDPNLRFVDLTGDGLTDVLLTADDGLTWYPGAGHDGFGDARQIGLAATEEHGPRLLLADPEQSVHLADMTGDGLTDLVRISDGEVAYWPSLGYGRFGAKVTMSGTPRFDHPDLFDHRRLHLFDVDGSAPADLLYVGADGIRLWFNQAGNSWSAPQHVDVPVDGSTGVSVADILGRGTGCVVLAQPRPDGEPQVRYVDLMAGGKPHLLATMDNHSGLRMSVTYRASTAYYLADKAAGRPWATRPAFPVQLVAEVEMRDSVADTTLATTYGYRHGYYDGPEREFRGFGYVEQRDALRKGRPGDQQDELVQPPALVKRWQHTGWYAGRDAVSRLFEDEYWPGDDGHGDGLWLPDTVLPDGLTTDEERQAARALRGSVLRTEVYAEDGGPLEKVPYQVTEHRYALRLVQPAQAAQTGRTARPGVLFAHHAETLTVQTERQAGDPRVSHEFTLQVDAYGNPVRMATVAYPRGSGDPEQRRSWITVRERDLTNDVATTTRWRLGTDIEAREYEIGGVAPARNATIFTSAVLDAGATAAAQNEIPYQDELSGAFPQRRLIARTATTYYSNDLETELPRGQIGERALVWRTYRQAFAAGQVAALFGEGQVTDATLTRAGYARRAEDGVWWAPSHRTVPDPECYFQPSEVIDPFGAAVTIEYDPYCLLPVRTRDSLGNTTQVQISYRVMQPWLLTDPNANRSGVRYDALGMVTATAVLGKEGADEGDLLDLSTPEISSTDDPTTRLVYDLVSVPVSVHTYARETHRTADEDAAAEPRWQESRGYFDGMGRVILTKTRAEPGPAPVRGPDGSLVRDPDGTLRLEPTDRRWVGTGRTIYDNKGDPVRQYEPYFAPDERFDTEDDLVRYGVTPILRHDPLGRLVGTELPDGTDSRLVFEAWRQESWDRNDTVRNSRWYAERRDLPETDPRGRAARQTLAHADTPTETRLDSLGRTYVTITDNGGGELFKVTVERDVQGNERSVVDARDVRVLRQSFDMLGNPAHTRSADAGERWNLLDVTGRPAYGRDSRGTVFRWTHDVLRRPTHAYATPAGGAERLRVRTYYGEALDDGVARNLRTRPCLIFDGAGAVRTVRDDFKGNTLATERRLAADPLTEPDWAVLAQVATPDQALTRAAALLEQATHATATTYDALNRPRLITSADGNRTRHVYNEAGLLETIDAQLGGATTWTPFVTGVDYNARRQRVLIELGCGAKTEYGYEPDTFRLSSVETRRPDGKRLQSLNYTYDPVGNVIVLSDPLADTVFFANTAVGSTRTYRYDPAYRLVEATGREHIGQTSTQPGPADVRPGSIPQPGDATAMRAYTESYVHDAADNILSVAHAAANGSWTRRHKVATDSNRLLASSIPGDTPDRYSATYDHDAGGNAISMPHLAVLGWDPENRLSHADLGGGGNAHYQYDSAGQRVRATVVKGGITETRLYLGLSERYQRTVNGAVRTERWTLHVMDGVRRFAMVETTTVDAALLAPDTVQRYQLTDHLGSVSVEVDENCAVLSYEEYHPYGTTSFHAARGAAEVSLKRYRFTGKEKDTETGFAYHGARYYALWLGRWTSPDPAGMVDGPNRYAYVRNNPVHLTDPNGQQSTEERAPLPDERTIRTLLKPRSEINAAAKARNSEIKKAAEDLLAARDEEIVTFVGDSPKTKTKPREDGAIAKQLKSIVDAPDDGPLPDVLDLGLARIIQRMVTKARARHKPGSKVVDFEIVSLTRTSDNDKSPHKHGHGLDLGRYAGKSLAVNKGAEQLEAVLTFYSDMIGNSKKGEKPVETRLALGLPRNARTTGEDAAKDIEKLRRSRMFEWEIIPGYGPQPIKREDVFFERDTTPDKSPSIKGSNKTLLNQNVSLLQPAAAQGFAELLKLDTTGVLKFLMPDGFAHFHVQSPP